MKWFTLALPSFLAVALAHAASFDCAKASTMMEKMICADAELSKLDEDLGEAYRKALQQNDVKQGAIESQRNWLKLERNVCADVPCLKQAYQKRIKELGSVCDAVVEAANSNNWSPIDFTPPKDGLVDINGDGKKEQVVILYQGSMHEQVIKVYSEDGKLIEFAHSPSDDWSSKNIESAMNWGLIKYKGKIYILGTDGGLHYLSNVDKNNVEKIVCEFGQLERPVETVTTSHNDKLCKLALDQGLQYVEFNQDNPLAAASQSGENTFGGFTTGKAAAVDINNDGKPVLVVNVFYSMPGGCDNDSLAVVNDTRNGLDTIFTRLLPQAKCGLMKHVPFVYEGQTYIEIRYSDSFPTNDHKVVQLKRGKLATICEYDVKVVNYVQDEYRH